MSGVPYKLRYPIVTTFSPNGGEDREETVSEVAVRRPVARDFRATDGLEGDVAKTLAMIVQLTGLMPLQVDKLDVVDMTAIGEIIENFMQPGRPTGGTR